MKCMLDTNILVSTALFPKSVSAAVYAKAVAAPFKTVVCEYALQELRRIFNEKFPDRIADHDRFVMAMATSVEIVRTPPEEERQESEDRIRDVKDRPILRSALAAAVEMPVTGDKDFSEADIDAPICMSASDFLHSS